IPLLPFSNILQHSVYLMYQKYQDTAAKCDFLLSFLQEHHVISLYKLAEKEMMQCLMHFVCILESGLERLFRKCNLLDYSCPQVWLTSVGLLICLYLNSINSAEGELTF
uniref:Uncharacterized protein n=1 Tax=Seriola dumerili TaxID=41447 RepID=A0A3B4VME2_SERDU